MNQLTYQLAMTRRMELLRQAADYTGRVGGRRPRRAAVRARLALVSSRRRIDPCQRLSG
jgi:hypothetical protein